MNVPEEQIVYKKKIGKLNGDPVIEVATKGGLHLVVSVHGNKVTSLGAGPHKAVARHIAKKKAPDIQFTELSKSDEIEEYLFEWCLPKYEALTDALRAARETHVD